jgi:hypothetical protein
VVGVGLPLLVPHYEAMEGRGRCGKDRAEMNETGHPQAEKYRGPEIHNQGIHDSCAIEVTRHRRTGEC